MARVWEEAFLSSLSITGIVTSAAEHAGIARRTAYDARMVDQDFAARWDDAIEQATDMLEQEAKRRAFEGCKKPVYQGGKLVGHVLEYSDSLMTLLLKANREKFREKHAVDLNFQPPPVNVRFHGPDESDD